MDPQHWQRVKEVFHRALELDASERAVYLDRACEGDEELRREIESLLASHRQADDFIEDSALSQAGAPTEAGDSLVGRSLGAYRILYRIGHGGMGTVYLAERNDAQYRQRVAVKLLKLGMDSDFFISRFRQERQILANLDHPAIARLLDGGALEDGRPYLVMEYIEGVPIDRYCTAHGLQVRQRVELFRKVCEAVQYAHRSLVIHRDLKPSNILVTEDGTPKLLDFGTAKLLDPSGFEPPATATGMRLMTPEFASPEQLRAESVTTASDVYTLGVVLYRLLTGQPPYHIPSPLSPEAVRVVCEQEPPRLSTAAESRDATTATRPSPDHQTAQERWRRHLTGDLDNIVLMALRKEPERRYSSVEQLSEDLRRYLEDLPVAARPDTVAYRAGKFVRRHRVGVLAAVLVLLAMTGGIVATAWQAGRAVAASERAGQNLEMARSEQARLEAVKGFLVDLFEISDPNESQGKDLTAREILARGAEKIEHELRGQPDLRASLLDVIGLIYHKQGNDDQAAELLERARRAAEELEGEPSRLRASILVHLGYVRRDQADFEQAAALFQQALELSPPGTAAAAEALNALGTYYHATGRYSEAREMHEKALLVRRELPRVDDLAVAHSRHNLGSVLFELGELDQAGKHLRAALELRRRHLAEPHVDIASSLNSLAGVLWKSKDLAGAEGFLEQTLALQHRLYNGRDHWRVANTLDNLGVLQGELGRYRQARAHGTKALQMRLRVLESRHPDIGFSYHNLGYLDERQGDLRQAESHYREALALWSASEQPLFENIRQTRFRLAYTLLKKGDHPGAAEEFERLHEHESQSVENDNFELSSELEALREALRQAQAHEAR